MENFDFFVDRTDIYLLQNNCKRCQILEDELNGRDLTRKFLLKCHFSRRSKLIPVYNFN